MKSNENFIDQEYIEEVLQKSEKTDYDEIERVLNHQNLYEISCRFD